MQQGQTISQGVCPANWDQVWQLTRGADCCVTWGAGGKEHRHPAQLEMSCCWHKRKAHFG